MFVCFFATFQVVALLLKVRSEIHAGSNKIGPTNFKWGYNPHEWPYDLVTAAIIGVIRTLYDIQLAAAHLVVLPELYSNFITYSSPSQWFTSTDAEKSRPAGSKASRTGNGNLEAGEVNKSKTLSHRIHETYSIFTN